MKIIETDNFGGDYPNEKFLNLPILDEVAANRIAAAINKAFPAGYPRYWRVVKDNYKLQPGFEP
jgi:hypothetical protein